MAIPTENVGSLPRPAKLQFALRHYDLGKITRETHSPGAPGLDRHIAREIAFKKIASRVQGTAMASEKLHMA